MKRNGFWVYNKTYKMKIWCIYKQLPTGVLALTYVVPAHRFGYSWNKGERIRFMSNYVKGNRMMVTYHVHPKHRIYKSYNWSFRSDQEVAQEVFVKMLTPIITN